MRWEEIRQRWTFWVDKSSAKTGGKEVEDGLMGRKKIGQPQLRGGAEEGEWDRGDRV
jgi:hypothetical protein